METIELSKPTENKQAFTIDTEEKADWYLRKLATIDSEIERIKGNTARRVDELTADRQNLVTLFESQAIEWAKGEKERRRRQTVTLTNGVIAFRKHDARLTVVDETAAIAIARQVCPDAVIELVTVKLDRDTLLTKASEMLTTTGEVLPGLEMLPAGESVKVTTGSKAK